MKAMFKNLWKRMNLTKNTTQKFFSLVFAIVFWLFVMDTENPEMTKVISRVPIELLGIEQTLAQGLQNMTIGDQFVDIRVHGRRKDVLTLTINDFKATVDVFQAKKGTMNFPLTVKSLGEGITVDSLSQTTIALDFDQIITSSKPVKIEIVGEPPEPYYLEQAKLENEYLDVLGPEQVVNRVAYIQGVMDVTGVTASFKSEFSLVAVDAQGKVLEGLKLSQSKQSVAFEIMKERRVPIVTDVVGSVPEGYLLLETLLSQEDIGIVGPEALVDAVEALTTQPIKLDGFDKNSEATVQFILPSGVKIKPNEVVKIKVAIDPLKRKVMTIAPEQVKWLNQKSEYEMAFESGTIEISLEGASRFMEALKETDVIVEIDLLGLEPGRHRLPINVVVPQNISWIKASAGEVAIDVLLTLKTGE